MPRSLAQGQLCFYRVRTDPGANRASCASVQEAFFFSPGVKWLEHEAVYSLAKGKNAWRHISTSLYVLVSWCFIKNGDIFTFVGSLCNGIITRLYQLAYVIVVMVVLVVVIIIIYRVTLFCLVIGFEEVRFSI
jgi:hypothetical protein